MIQLGKRCHYSLKGTQRRMRSKAGGHGEAGFETAASVAGKDEVVDAASGAG